MAYLQKLFFAAIIAGSIGGIFASALNISITVPMILQAEISEHAAEHAHAGEQGGHEHPEMSAFARNTLTVVGMMLAHVGFALMMTVLAELKGSLASWKSGLAWGAAGYLIFSLVPALGLPPELPGMPAPDLLQRQVWWITCTACTAGAIVSAVNYRSPRALIAAAVLVAMPFLIGAPAAPEMETLVPATLHHEFVIGTLAANLVTWLVMGLSLGMIRSPARPRLATLSS
ncbi:cobalt transporter subunit CbtA [Agrobacterium tumefaciens]|uniref:Cobalt transporter subunit CbtA n=1 Tax=Agrobacterium tumefaciens TaxID=358 RepID=A0AAW8M2D0_AGRTU|nr:CbtA family protein [Agrobacterium tumefaciens]MBP2568562.1 cobalt transporter subunit CbtA [Agrobacterium tumefaciens]MDR6705269.1 cobalt transporter subunit CbtA [Agrobacterium tumefaciens]